MSDAVINIGWAVVFSIVGGIVGVVLVLAASVVLPKLIDRFTPNLDEGKKSPAATWPSRNTSAVSSLRASSASASSWPPRCWAASSPRYIDERSL